MLAASGTGAGVDIATAHRQFTRAVPPDRELQAISQALGLGAVVEVVRLQGGLESAVHRVAYEHATIVTRRFSVSRGWHPPERIRGEAAVLRALEGTDVPAPCLLFVDEDGSSIGCPAIVQSLLPGAAMAPPRPDQRTMAQLVEVALTLHDVPPIGSVPSWQESWLRAEPEERRAASPVGAACWEAIVQARAELEVDPRVMAHHDLHPGNTLWLDGQLTGLVDWGSAGPGFAGSDAGYCAGDLWLSLGQRAARGFLDAWRSGTGAALHPGWIAVGAWDLLLDAPMLVEPYAELGMAVTDALIEQRLGEMVDWARAELGLPAR